MHAPDDNTTAPRFRSRHLMTRWEHRHPRTSAGIRLTSGGFQLSLGLVLLSIARQAETDQDRRKFGWLSALFLGMAAPNIAGGCLSLAATRVTQAKDAPAHSTV
jgi:hypothetical protein